MTRMATLAPSGRIDEATVDEEIARLRRTFGVVSLSGPSRARRLLGDAIAEHDRFDLVQLEDVIAVCQRSATLSSAGRELFAASRARKTRPNDADRLRKYLARFELSWADIHPRG
jgi:transcriptional regulatory protein RtcR